MIAQNLSFYNVYNLIYHQFWSQQSIVLTAISCTIISLLSFKYRLKQIDYTSLLLQLKISTLIDQNAKIFEQKIDETAKQLMMNIYDNLIQTFNTEKKWHFIEIIIYMKLVIKSILRLKNRIEAFIYLKHSSSMTEKTSIKEKNASVSRKRTLFREFTAFFNKSWTSINRRRV